MNVLSAARPLVALLAVSLVAVACGSGDKTNEPASTPRATSTAAAPATATAVAPAATDTAVAPEASTSAEEVIRQAAIAQQDIETVRATMTMEMDFGGETVTIDADIQMEGTRALMTMRMFGEELEMLVDLPDVYVNVPGDGWYRADGASLGLDTSQFEQLIEDEGLVNLNALADLKDQNFEELPGETINGEAHRRLRANLTFDELLRLNPESADLIPPEGAALLEETDGSVIIDVWVSEATGIATRTEMDMTMDMLGMELNMLMRFDVVEVNGPVSIPAAPANARDISELQGF